MKSNFWMGVLAIAGLLSFSAPAFAVTAEEKEALKSFEKIPTSEVTKGLKSLSCLASNGVRIRFQANERAQYQLAYASFGFVTLPFEIDFHFTVDTEKVHVELQSFNPFVGLGAGKSASIELSGGLPENNRETVLSGSMMAADVVMTPVMPVPVPRYSAITCKFVYDYNVAP
jgi:hypothetical protein